MVRHKIIPREDHYYCDVCNHSYSSNEEAEKCESQGVPKPEERLLGKVFFSFSYSKPRRILTQYKAELLVNPNEDDAQDYLELVPQNYFFLKSIHIITSPIEQRKPWIINSQGIHCAAYNKRSFPEDYHSEYSFVIKIKGGEILSTKWNYLGRDIEESQIEKILTLNDILSEGERKDVHGAWGVVEHRNREGMTFKTTWSDEYRKLKDFYESIRSK